MIYVMSDIHGHYDHYRAMLDRIGFQDQDVMFILGDVIDRGPDGIKILQDMMVRTNVYPILGNHEYMALTALPWLFQEVTEESVDRIDTNDFQGVLEWMEIGGDKTIEAFSVLDKEEQSDILEYLKEFSPYELVQAGGKNFVLVHAGLTRFSSDRPLEDYDLSELLFFSPDFDRTYFKNAYLVTGHTLTRVLYAMEQGLSLADLSPDQYQDLVFQKNNHIAIDCGLSYGGRLACLCLDNLEVFYV